MTATRSQPRKAARPRWNRGPLSATNGADFLIVAIGVSAGGLEACKRLIDALPGDNRMAFLIVQHLEPSRESLLVDLLSARTSMQVVQATDGMQIECERVHIIPPEPISRSMVKAHCVFRDRRTDTRRGFRSISC